MLQASPQADGSPEGSTAPHYKRPFKDNRELGGSFATNVTVVSGTSITATTPARAAGTVKVSFAPMQEVLKATGMQYGGIAPLGLPSDWPILLDTRIEGLGVPAAKHGESSGE